MRRLLISVLAVALCLPSVMPEGKVEAKTKRVKKTFVVMEGATRELTSIADQETKISVTKKKVASATADEESGYSRVSYKAGDGYGYGVLVKGKKTGTTKVTVRNGSEKTIYTVKTISKSGVKKTSKKLLKKYAASLKKTKQCAYYDFNGDGIKDLYHDGKFTYYNYATKKVVTKKAPLTSIKELYVSAENHLMFAIPREETALGEKLTNGNYEAYLYGKFFLMNQGKVFDFLSNDVEYRRYGEPKEYVGANYVEGTEYYFLGDSGYDQDDYWYEPFTKEEMDKKLGELMPKMKQVKMTKKPVIK